MIKPMAMVTRTGKGKELSDLLRKELKIPDRVVSFSVHFAVDDVVYVECKYMPAEHADD